MHHDHKEAGEDPAVAVLRIDSPVVGGKRFEGQWKLFFDPALLRQGKARPYMLYDLKTDQMEEANLIDRADVKPLIEYISELAVLHRNAGGHRLAEMKLGSPIEFDFRSNVELDGAKARNARIAAKKSSVRATISAEKGDRSFSNATFTSNFDGLGVSGGDANAVDGNEAILIRFNRNVVVEYASLLSSSENSGGHYTIGDGAPLSIYCVNADIDEKDQSGVLSDLGVLKAGQTLRLDSRARFPSEHTGSWTLQSLSVREIK
tara:strand:- start:134 stop:919 length:786 start_codon:yes stop_codon:yes gene_type:complete